MNGSLEVVLRLLRAERLTRLAIEDDWEQVLINTVAIPFTLGFVSLSCARLEGVDEPQHRDSVSFHEHMDRGHLVHAHAAVRLHVLSGENHWEEDWLLPGYHTPSVGLPEKFYAPLSNVPTPLAPLSGHAIRDPSRGHMGMEQAERAGLMDEEAAGRREIVGQLAAVAVSGLALEVEQQEAAWRRELLVDEFEARHLYLIRPHTAAMTRCLQSSGPGGISFVANSAIQSALHSYHRRNGLRPGMRTGELFSGPLSPALRHESIISFLLACFSVSARRPHGAPPTPFPHGSEPICRLLISKLEAQARVDVAAMYISCRLLWEEEWARMQLQLAQNFWKIACLRPLLIDIVVKEQQEWDDLCGVMKPFLTNVREEMAAAQSRRSRLEAKRSVFKALREREMERRVETALNRDQFTLLMKAEQLQSILDVQDRYVSIAIQASPSPVQKQLRDAHRPLCDPARLWAGDVNDDDALALAELRHSHDGGEIGDVSSRLLALTEDGSEDGEHALHSDVPSVLAARFERDLRLLASPSSSLHDMQSYYAGLVAFENTLSKGEEELLGEEWTAFRGVSGPHPTVDDDIEIMISDDEGGGSNDLDGAVHLHRSPSYGSSLGGGASPLQLSAWGRHIEVASPSRRIHAAHTAREPLASMSPKPRLERSLSPQPTATVTRPLPHPSLSTPPHELALELFKLIESPADEGTSLFGRLEGSPIPQMRWGVQKRGIDASPIRRRLSSVYQQPPPNPPPPPTEPTAVRRDVNPPPFTATSPSGRWFEPSTVSLSAGSPMARQPISMAAGSRSPSVSTLGGDRRPLTGVPLPPRSGSVVSSVQSFPASLASYQYQV